MSHCAMMPYIQRGSAFMKQTSVYSLTTNALSIALVCLSTMLFKVPIPLGYAHLGNAFILLSAVFFGPLTGFLAGGFGSALADFLSGYPQWILPTWIIKGIMGLVIGLIAENDGRIRMKGIRTALSAAAGTAIMIAGYFIAGIILYGSVYTSSTQLPGLTAEGIVGILLFYIIGSALCAAHFPGYLRKKQEVNHRNEGKS